MSDTVKNLVESGREQQALKAEISQKFEDSVYNFDCGNSLAEWKEAQNSWILPKILKSGKLVKSLNSHAKSPETVTKENFGDYCVKLVKLKSLTDAVNSIPTAVSSLFDSHTGLIMGENTRWDAVSDAVSLSQNLRCMLSDAPFTNGEKQQISQGLCELFGTSQRKADNSKSADLYIEKINKCENILTDLEKRFALVPDKIYGNNPFEETKKQIGNVISELPTLKEWTGILAICRNLEELGLQNAVDSFLSGKLSCDDLIGAFECGISRDFIYKTLGEVPALAKFQGSIFEDTIRKFEAQLEKFRRRSLLDLYTG